MKCVAEREAAALAAKQAAREADAEAARLAEEARKEAARLAEEARKERECDSVEEAWRQASTLPTDADAVFCLQDRLTDEELTTFTAAVEERRAAELRREAEAREEEARLAAERESKVKERSLAILPAAALSARTQIYNKLKAPSTAKFNMELLDRDGFCYAYFVTVDAQNGFGAYIRSRHCVLLQITDPWEDDPSHFRGMDVGEDALGPLLKTVCNNEMNAKCK